MAHSRDMSRRTFARPLGLGAHHRVVPYVSRPDAAIPTRASSVTENRKPGVTPTAARTLISGGWA